uniref:Chromo domain-containing protein n=1 Tax=Panagrolaimus superbus TaxID=310955 RepID=A0A914Z4P0_9BILA
MAPAEVNSENSYEILQREILPVLFQDPSKTKFKHKVGDEVRVKTRKTTFQRGYDPPFSHRVWEIKEAIPTAPPTYRLKDQTKKKKKDQHVDGLYYHNETSAFPASDATSEFQINIIKSKTVRGKLMHLVEYIGYPDPPKWIEDNMIMN